MTLSRKFIVMMFSMVPLTSFADGTCGGVDYSQGADALAETYNFVTIMIIYMGYLINTFGVIVGLYGALQIYLKMMTGQGEVTKSILFLVGGALFLIGGMVVLPSVFGYNWTDGGIDFNF